MNCTAVSSSMRHIGTRCSKAKVIPANRQQEYFDSRPLQQSALRNNKHPSGKHCRTEMPSLHLPAPTHFRKQPCFPRSRIAASPRSPVSPVFRHSRKSLPKSQITNCSVSRSANVFKRRKLSSIQTFGCPGAGRNRLRRTHQTSCRAFRFARLYSRAKTRNATHGL